MKYQPPHGEVDAEAPYINGDPSIARKGSILPAGAAEYPQREIVNFIENSNQIPTDGDLEQLTRGIRNQWVNFCVDTGAVNNLSVALTPALQAYRQGLPLRVLVKNNNTGPSTINVNSLGNKPIKRANGAELQPDDMRAGMIALLVDDSNVFQMVNFQGVTSSVNNQYNIDIPYAEDTGTANNILTFYSPPITGQVAGDLVLVKVKVTNTGAVMFKINGPSSTPQPIYRNDGQPLQAYDLLGGECILIEYNTTYWQMLRLVRSQVYFKLNADLTLYVRIDGNDTSGDGSLNDASHAFKTVQRAINFVRESFLIAGRKVKIILGMTGTYTGSALITDLPGSITIQGGDTPSAATAPNYVMQASPNNSVIGMGGSGTSVTVTGVTLSLVTANYNVLEVNYGATCNISNLWLSGNQAYSHIASTAGNITASGDIHFWSNAQYGISLGQGATLTIGLWSTTITGHGGHYFQAFLNCSTVSVAQITYPYCTFAGYMTGYRYYVSLNSVILTGGGPTYLLGNIDGLAATNGLYV